MNRTLIFAVLVTGLLFMIPNKSNIPNGIAIPTLTALLTKYTMGDWDSGFRWTSMDIPYWVSILGVSWTTLKLLT
jgi:hypothetical protein